jgi:hypothetical protein
VATQGDGKFEFGKLTLIQLRNRQAHELAQYGVSNNEIDRVINQNRATKQQFALMVNDLGKTFKNQINEPKRIKYECIFKRYNRYYL